MSTILTTDRTKKFFAFAEQKAAETQAQAEAKRDIPVPQQMFLPGLEDWLRAMPNPIARSSLFAPVARGRKKYHVEAVLVSMSDAVITYTGLQLDEAQSDVWMQLMYKATNSMLGQPVVIERAGFLKAIGRNTSGENYNWLHRTMKAFTAATIVIEVRKHGIRKYCIGDTQAFHMLAGFDFDAESGRYTYTVDPRWKKLFDGREFALIDWNKRLQIRQGQDMAKALQRLVATSSDTVQRFSLDWLKEKLQYSGRMRDFKTALDRAMEELGRVEVLAEGHFGLSTKGKEQVVWTRLPKSKSS